jgi:hypothetical protein
MIIGIRKLKCLEINLPHCHFDNKKLHMYYTETEPALDMGRSWHTCEGSGYI